MRVPIPFLILLACSWSCSASVLDLSGSDWRVVNSNRTVDVPASVPGYALQALQAAGVISDIHYRFEELESRWVALEQWTFYKDFKVSPCYLKMKEVDLYMEHVDTFAVVLVNNKKVATLSNFHRWHRIPIKWYLVAGDNNISVVIDSAIEVTRVIRARYPYKVPILAAVGAFDLFNFARKTASDFGWDWGPAFVPSGIAGALSLEAYQAPLLTGAFIRQEFGPEAISLTVLCELEVPHTLKGGKFQGTLVARIEDLGIVEEKVVVFERGGQQVEEVELIVETARVKLWWPVGLGSQPLYSVEVQFIPERTVQTEDLVGCTGTAHIQRLHRRVGFRDVRLMTLPLKEARRALGVAHKAEEEDAGESFFFQVNGVPVYAKGSNVIPMNVVPTEVTPSYLTQMLQYAKEANMNMIRIWGGGMYQRDELYDWCDEHGLMVWQEAMFACAPYPRSEGFIKEVQKELRQQVMRLGSHPSIVVWGGNNEIEASFEWYEETRKNLALYAVDFQKLFVEVIGELLAEMDPQRPYLDSSPSNGHLDVKMGIKRWGNAQDIRYGDVHYYNYMADCQDYRHYPQAKFVSEHGFQSYPSWSTLEPVTTHEDWSVTSAMTEHRQRHGNGTNELLYQLGLHFRLPESWEVQGQPAETERRYRNWLYLTQVQQMMCYETALGTWRRWRSDPQALTMGVLYWQLNDIWAGASWSSLNYDLRWKPVHYVVRRAFASLAVVGLMEMETDTVKVYAVNDHVTDQILRLEVYLDSLTDRQSSPCRGPIAVIITPVPALSAREVWTQGREELLARVPGCDASHCYLTLVQVGPSGSTAPLGMAQQKFHIEAVADVDQMLFDNDVNVFGGEEQSPAESGLGGPLRRAAGKRSRQHGGSITEGGQDEVHVWLRAFKDLIPLRSPEVEVGEVAQLTTTGVRFRVVSRTVAVYVVMETSLAGYFDRNAFVLHPCRPQWITFHGRDSVAAEKLMADIKITSLYDTQP